MAAVSLVPPVVLGVLIPGYQIVFEKLSKEDKYYAQDGDLFHIGLYYQLAAFLISYAFLARCLALHGLRGSLFLDEEAPHGAQADSHARELKTYKSLMRRVAPSMVLILIPFAALTLVRTSRPPRCLPSRRASATHSHSLSLSLWVGMHHAGAVLAVDRECSCDPGARAGPSTLGHGRRRAAGTIPNQLDFLHLPGRDVLLCGVLLLPGVLALHHQAARLPQASAGAPRFSLRLRERESCDCRYMPCPTQRTHAMGLLAKSLAKSQKRFTRCARVQSNLRPPTMADYQRANSDDTGLLLCMHEFMALRDSLSTMSHRFRYYLTMICVMVITHAAPCVLWWSGA